MNLLLLSPDELDGEIAELDGRRSRHVREVIGAVPGERLRAGVEHGPTGEAEVLELGERVRVRFRSAGSQPSPPTVDLILALPRPKALSRLVEHVSSFGVGRVELINAWRVDKSYFDSPRATLEALRASAVLGCEQGRHTWIPDLVVHRRFMAWAESLPRPAERTRLVAHPGMGDSLSRRLCGEGRVVIAIGPEGGWIERELATLDELAFARVQLSNRILRSEVAAIAALAQLELVSGRSR